MPDAKDLLTDIAKRLADGLPELALNGIDKGLESLDPSDSVGRAALTLLRQLVVEKGTDALNEGFDAVVGLIQGTDPSAAFALRGQPDELEALVDALQSAEAEQRRKVAAWVVQLGKVFTALGAAVAANLL